METINSLSLPEIPLTYEEIQEELKPIEEYSYDQRKEYLKEIKTKIYEELVRNLRGIKEDNDNNMNMIKLMILGQWIRSRIKIFQEFVEGRKKFLSQDIRVYPLKQKIISLEINFLEWLIKDFQKRNVNVEKLLQKCYTAKQ